MVKPESLTTQVSTRAHVNLCHTHDSSGSQALKALKEAGVKSVLLNPNIATIQTSHVLADEIYYLPVTPEYAEYVIQKEKPDGIFLSFGGQTALNLGVQMDAKGIFEKYGVKVLGTSVQTLKTSEDLISSRALLMRSTFPSPSRLLFPLSTKHSTRPRRSDTLSSFAPRMRSVVSVRVSQTTRRS